MSQRWTVVLGLIIGMAVYTPIGMYLFDNSVSTLLDRAYFTMAGAAIALYAQS